MGSHTPKISPAQVHPPQITVVLHPATQLGSDARRPTSERTGARLASRPVGVGDDGLPAVLLNFGASVHVASS